MTEIKLNIENLTESERKQLMELVEKGSKTESKAWKPKYGEMFWRVGGVDGPYSLRWANYDGDELLYSIGNCFKTKEEAEFAIERLKIRAELQRYADEHNEPIDWDNNRQNKYGITYSHEYKELKVWFTLGIKDAFQIYFTSEEIAKAAIKAVGEERIKKYLFEVE